MTHTCVKRIIRTTSFRIVASDTFRNRQTFRVTVHGLYAVVTGLSCVFCIVSQNCDFVKNFFRFVASGTFSAQSDEVRTGHSTGHFVPVTAQPFLTVQGLYHRISILSSIIFACVESGSCCIQTDELTPTGSSLFVRPTVQGSGLRFPYPKFHGFC